MNKSNNLILTILIHLLTFIAGFLNGVFFITAGTAVSHHTGTITRIALALSTGAVAEVAACFVLILSFYSGACISGMLFYRSDCTFSKRYGFLLLIFSMLFFALAVIKLPVRIALPITCAVLGIQNGMFIPYDGILIRTTHFTGYVTDAGLALGKVLRGKRQEWRRGVHYLSGIAWFAAGAAASALMPSAMSLYSIALLYFVTAIFYFAFLFKRVPQNSRGG